MEEESAGSDGTPATIDYSQARELIQAAFPRGPSGPVDESIASPFALSLADIAMEVGNELEAEKLYSHVLARDDEGIPSCWARLGLARISLIGGDFEKSGYLTNTALDAAPIKEKLLRAALHNQAGKIFSATGRLNEASEAFEESITLKKEEGDLIGIANSLHNLTQLASDSNDIEEMEHLMMERLAIETEISDNLRIAEVEADLAYLFGQQGRFEEALSHGQAGLHHAEKSGDITAKFVAHWGLAELSRLTSRVDLELSHLAQVLAISLAEDISLPDEIKQRIIELIPNSGLE